MSTGSQSPAQVTTQTSTPWSGAEPFLSSMYANAENLQQNQIGYQPYPGNLQAPLDPNLAQGFQYQADIAGQSPYGTAGITTAQNLGTQMMQQGGLTPEQLGIAGQMQGNVDQYYNQYGQWGNQLADIYGNAGALGAAAPGQYNQIFGNAGNVYAQNAGQQNPYLQAQIAASNRQIADKVNSAMSGAGRYGSGVHTDVATRAMAEAANPILAQDYTQRQQTMLGALGAQQAAATGGVQAGLGALGAQQAAATAGGQLGLGTLGGAQSALGQASGIYGGGQNLAGQWATAMPGLDQAQYAPAQALQQFGAFYQDRAQQDLANQVATYNAQQALPWEQLSRQANILAGAGGLGGTKVTTANPFQPTTLQKVGGGAVAGAGLGSIFGPTSAGLGAAAGGLLGLM